LRTWATLSRGVEQTFGSRGLKVDISDYFHRSFHRHP
jgi:hypothetical protein